MKKLTAILLAALLVLSLTACGSGGGKDPIIGEWDLFALTDLNDTSSSTAVPSGSGSITFNDDGSFTLVIDTDSYFRHLGAGRRPDRKSGRRHRLRPRL